MIHTITNHVHGQRSFPINTIIGVASGVVLDRQSLSPIINIPVIRMPRLETIGNEYHIGIVNSYVLGAGYSFRFSNIVSYNDIGGLVTAVNGQAFRDCAIKSFTSPLCTAFYGTAFGYTPSLNIINCPNLKNIFEYCFYGCSGLTSITTQNVESILARAFLGTSIPIMNFPKLTSIGDGIFYNCSATTQIIMPILETISYPSEVFRGTNSITLISMKKLKVLGDPSVQVSTCFQNMRTGCTIEVNVALATADNGNPNQTLIYAKNARLAIVKFYDDAGNYVSTL